MHVAQLSVSCANALAGLCDFGCQLAVDISVVNSASGPSPNRRASSGESSASRFVPRGDPLTVSASGPLPVNLGSSGAVSAGRFRICLALRSSASLADDPIGGVTGAPGAIGGGNVLFAAGGPWIGSWPIIGCGGEQLACWSVVLALLDQPPDVGDDSVCARSVLTMAGCL